MTLDKLFDPPIKLIFFGLYNSLDLSRASFAFNSKMLPLVCDKKNQTIGSGSSPSQVSQSLYQARQHYFIKRQNKIAAELLTSQLLTKLKSKGTQSRLQFKVSPVIKLQVFNLVTFIAKSRS